MDLNETNIIAKKVYSGSGTFSAVAGETIEVVIGGVNKLDAEVPENKNWETIFVNLVIDEVDA